MILNFRSKKKGGGTASIDVIVIGPAVSGVAITASAPNAPMLSGVTDAEGRVRLTGAVIGATYLVTGTLSGYTFNTSAVRIEHFVNRVTVNDSGNTVVNISVTDGGGASVYKKTVNCTGPETMSAQTDSHGKVSFSLMTAGTYTFALDPESIPEGAEVSECTVTAAGGDTFNEVLAITYVKYWGVAITEATADCAARVSYEKTLRTGTDETPEGTYTNSAYGATPMSGAGTGFDIGSWGSDACAELIEGIKPVAFDGTEWTDLPRTSETFWPQDVDIFTEFPFRWLSITKYDGVIYVVFSDSHAQPDPTFQDWAFLGPDGSTRHRNFHLGCFTASGSASGVYSKGSASGVFNWVSGKLNQYWYGAYSRDPVSHTYDCLPFQMWVYIQALFLVLYKSTDSQTAHSKGYVEGQVVHHNVFFESYGNRYGMYGSTADGTTPNAFFWLHNLWGNIYQFSASIFLRAGESYTPYYLLGAMSDPDNWDNSSWNQTGGTNYAMMTSLGTSSGSITKRLANKYTRACGSNGAGFILASDAVVGSDTEYWPDFSDADTNDFVAFFSRLGGYYGSGTNGGLFCASIYVNSLYAGSYYSSRLAYRGGR